MPGAAFPGHFFSRGALLCFSQFHTIFSYYKINAIYIFSFTMNVLNIILILYSIIINDNTQTHNRTQQYTHGSICVYDVPLHPHIFYSKIMVNIYGKKVI